MFYSRKSFHSEYIHSNIYFIASNKSYIKFYYGSVFTLFSKEIQMIWPFQPVATSIHTSEFIKHILRRTSIKGQSHCSHHCQKIPEKAPRGSLKKKDHSDEQSSPICLELQMKVYKPVMISHHRLFEKEVRALEEWVLHRQHLDEYPIWLRI